MSKVKVIIICILTIFSFVIALPDYSWAFGRGGHHGGFSRRGGHRDGHHGGFSRHGGHHGLRRGFGNHGNHGLYQGFGRRGGHQGFRYGFGHQGHHSPIRNFGYLGSYQGYRHYEQDAYEYHNAEPYVFKYGKLYIPRG